MTTHKWIRAGLWALIGVVVVGVSLAALGILPGGQRGSGPGGTSLGAPFTLTAMTGEPYHWGPDSGKPHAIYFGFTFCPDVCPTTLFELTNWLDKLGPDGDKIQALFITVDPERDTADKLANYLGAFDKRILGLTGTQAEIEKVAADFRIYHKKVPLEDGDYTMDHTASILLFKADGTFFGTIAYGENEDNAVAKLKRLAES
ncbi:MAG: SCO family protein [Rhodobiaceae bacterium]|nr:SCO family protein [Rhodobiaceae bacterium]